jgi:hypothetical protein
MKKIQELHDKAEHLLELARDMERKMSIIKESGFGYTDDYLDTCERGRLRLIESYKRVLKQIIDL